jgi:hypothetical protein
VVLVDEQPNASSLLRLPEPVDAHATPGVVAILLEDADERDSSPKPSGSGASGARLAAEERRETSQQQRERAEQGQRLSVAVALTVSGCHGAGAAWYERSDRGGGRRPGEDVLAGLSAIAQARRQWLCAVQPANRQRRKRRPIARAPTRGAHARTRRAERRAASAAARRPTYGAEGQCAPRDEDDGRHKQDRARPSGGSGRVLVGAGIAGRRSPDAEPAEQDDGPGVPQQRRMSAPVEPRRLAHDQHHPSVQASRRTFDVAVAHLVRELPHLLLGGSSTSAASRLCSA